jgi:hypothetical protein
MFLEVNSLFSKCSSLKIVRPLRYVYGSGGLQQYSAPLLLIRRNGIRRLHAKNFDDSSSLLFPLLESAIQRSKRTLATGHRDNSAEKHEENNREEESLKLKPLISSLLQTASDRALDTLSSRQSTISTGEESNGNEKTNGDPLLTPDGSITATATRKTSRFLDHPAIKNTALAHLLWKECIYPWEDTVIDATCGNGNDSLALAKILFPSKGSSSSSLSSPEPQLICLDIQEQAISNTISSMKKVFGDDDKNIFRDYIKISQSSHERLLSKPNDLRSVGLICYNLGFLPGGTDKDCKTQTSCTIHSLVDASLLVRVGGMISVMTYPRTNEEEAISVKMFLTGLSMLSSKSSSSSWEEELFNSTINASPEIRDLIRDALHRTVREGCKIQTWRVFEHASLGRHFSPVLLTATRIK